MMKIHAIQTSTVAVTTGRRRDGRPSAWPRVDDGDNRLLAIEGPPGIGKTALMAIRCRTDGAPLSRFAICRPTVSPDATLERKSAARP